MWYPKNIVFSGFSLEEVVAPAQPCDVSAVAYTHGLGPECRCCFGFQWVLFLIPNVCALQRSCVFSTFLSISSFLMSSWSKNVLYVLKAERRKRSLFLKFNWKLKHFLETLSPAVIHLFGLTLFHQQSWSKTLRINCETFLHETTDWQRRCKTPWN